MSFLINLFGHCFLFFKEQSPCIGSEYIFDNTRSGASIRRLEIRSELISFKVTLSSKLTRNIQYILKWPYLFHLRHRFSMKKKMKKKTPRRRKKGSIVLYVYLLKQNRTLFRKRNPGNEVE